MNGYEIPASNQSVIASQCVAVTAHARIEDLQSQLYTERAEIAELKEHISDLESVEKTCEELRAEITELKEHISDLENVVETHEDLSERLEAAESLTGRAEIVHETMRTLDITYRDEHGPWRTISTVHRLRIAEAVRRSL